MAGQKLKLLPKTFKDLPMCMTPKDVAIVLGVSMPTVYEIVSREDFPSIRVGENKNRQKIIIPRDRFFKWLYKEDYEAITGEPDPVYSDKVISISGIVSN